MTNVHVTFQVLMNDILETFLRKFVIVLCNDIFDLQQLFFKITCELFKTCFRNSQYQPIIYKKIQVHI
jgi:hypothetical protein